MKEKKTIGINALLNMARSVMGMLFPLITFPYASRILSVSNIGKVNYASSVVSYFSLFAMLGIPVYATREGARIREDKGKTERFVSEVFSLNILASIISMIVLFALIYATDIFDGYESLLLIYAIQIPLTVIGTDWINSIFEDYFYITVRSLLFQLIGLILIFCMVREPSDYYRYAICLVVTSYGSGILNAFYTKKYCKKKITFNLKIIKHLKPVLVLFATNLAALIYTSADTTMLGLMSTDYNVGIYTTAAKVYGIFKQLAFAVVIVCLPRFSYIVANKTKAEYEKLAGKLFKVVLTLAFPLAVGIYFLSGPIIQILAGENFMPSIYPLKLLSIAIFVAILAYFVMQLVLLPNKKDSVILKATVISGIFNIVGNFLLIPRYLENAAAFTTVISELIVLIITWNASQKIVKLKFGRKNTISVFIAGSMMGLTLYGINKIEMGALITLLLGFIVGSAVYLTILVVARNDVVIEGISIIKKYLIKREKSAF